MKKFFTLLALAVLGVTSSVWADSVNDLKPISSTWTFVADAVTSNGSTKLSANKLYANGYIFAPTANSVATNKGKSTFGGSEHLNSLRLKNTQDQLVFKVGGPCTITFYTQSHASRGIQAGTTAGGTELGTQPVSTTEWELTINSATTVYLSSYGGDFYFAGFVATFVSNKTPSSFAITSEASITLDKDETSQITYVNNAGTVTFSSSNSSIATVSETGLITAKGTGEAVITVSDPGSDEVDGAEKNISVKVNFARKATEITGEFVISPANGTVGTAQYLSNDGSLLIDGSFDSGSNLYSDMKNDHMKLASKHVITLPTNYPVTTVDIFGFSNSDADATITLKEADGTEINETATLGNKTKIPVADAVSFKLETPATETITIEFSRQVRGYIVLNRNNQTVSMTQLSDGKYYATYYFAAEQKISGAKAYTATLNETKLTLTECEDNIIPARTGVVLIGEASTATLEGSYTGATKEVGDLIGASSQNVSMTSYYNADVSAEGKVFTLAEEGNKIGFYKYTGEKLNSKRAYLYSESLASAPAIYFSFEEETEVTGVYNLRVEEKANAAFDLTGRRANGKGLMIQNGKVVLVK